MKLDTLHPQLAAARAKHGIRPDCPPHLYPYRYMRRALSVAVSAAGNEWRGGGL